MLSILSIQPILFLFVGFVLWENTLELLKFEIFRSDLYSVQLRVKLRNRNSDAGNGDVLVVSGKQVSQPTTAGCSLEADITTGL